jgi:hypothetical protein
MNIKFLLLLILIILIFITLKKKELFLTNKDFLEKEFPQLIKDKRTLSTSSYKCLDYEDIKI